MNQININQLIEKINPKKLNWNEKKSICERWKVSGKSKTHFCKEHGLSFQTFWGWCDRLWPRSNKKEKRWAPVKIINQPDTAVEQSQTMVELILPNQGIIRFKMPTKHLALFIQDMTHATTTLR